MDGVWLQISPACARSKPWPALLLFVSAAANPEAAAGWQSFLRSHFRVAISAVSGGTPCGEWRNVHTTFVHIDGSSLTSSPGSVAQKLGSAVE